MSKKTKKMEVSLEGSHANQYLLDPRQQLCWSYYVNPKSETFGNAYRSAIKAGYKRGHAIKITSELWWGERRRRLGLLSKAEKVLDETLDLPHIVPAMGPFGPLFDKETGQPIMTVSTSVLRIKQDSAKFVTETQGKAFGYTKKTDIDLTTDGEKLEIFNDKQLEKIARGLLNGHSTVQK